MLNDEQNLQALVGDLSYKTDRRIVNALNKHLVDCGSNEGGFFVVSDAAARLWRLNRLKGEGKQAEADAFNAQLDSFAGKYKITANAFRQWQAVMDCRDIHNRLSHLVRNCSHQDDVQRLKDALDNREPVLQPCCDAVNAMLILGQHFNVL